MTKELSFKDLKLTAPLQKAVAEQGYKIPTPIQLQSIPPLLEGRDLIGIAQTGTGKTAAFTLPILQRMKEGKPREIQTLVLAPTRELAAQINESFATYGKHLDLKHTVIFGGVRQGKQVRALRAGVDILVATPGRLLDLMNQRFVRLDKVEFFVLDEADRMLDMGFIHDIKKVIARLPDKRQSLFFSATMSPTVNTLANSLLRDPVHVEVAAQATTVDRITQKVFFVDQTEKLHLLLRLLNGEDSGSVLIFTRTKHRADKLAFSLNRNGIPADAIHGNKSQHARTKAISNFKTGITKVLVATDIAARGIDIPNISHVINFELPNEADSYVHRIGRTARAGNEGIAYSFCEAREREYLRDIEKLINQKIEVIVDHKYHSERAQNATGFEAKPLPKGRRSFRSRSHGVGSFSGKRKDSRGENKASYNSSSKGRKPYRAGSSGSGGSSFASKRRKPFSRNRNNKNNSY